MGYRRTGRIRSTPAVKLSRKQCYPDSLLSRLSNESCQCPRQGTNDIFHHPPASNSYSNSVQWYPEVAHFCEGTPFILVATKTDLRKDEQTRSLLRAQGLVPVTSEQGATVAKEIGAKYAECSAKNGVGVQEVFQLALKESMKGRWGKMRNKGCVVV